MTSLLNAALAYAARRLPVFPCTPRDKAPAIRGGFHSATTNPETVRRYWRVPDRNIGIPTGIVSGVWVLDVDGPEGAESLCALEAIHGHLPKTWTVTTARGWHFWFHCPGPIPSSAARIAAGLDVRADLAYAIAPPSVHPSGHVYTWVIPPDSDPTDAPAWLLELARRRPAPAISEQALATIRPRNGAGKPGRYGRAALEAEIAALADAAPGGRNHALNRASFRLGQLVAGGELDRRDVTERLIEASHRNGLAHDDGMSSVTQTLQSGFSAGMRCPRARGAA